MLTLSVVFLLIAFPARVFGQDLSVKDTNTVIEIFNNCTCLIQDECDDPDSSPANYTEVEERSFRIKGNTNLIRCSSQSPSIELYCCKQPRQPTTTIKPLLKNFQTENTILEVFHKCKCVPEDQCGVSNSIESYDSNTVMQSTRVNQTEFRIVCQSEWPTKLYCCKQPDNDAKSEVEENSPREEERMKCGTGFWSIMARILTRSNDIPIVGEFPWMTAIFRKGKRRIHCGGSLIHPKVVLTASHCVHSLRPGDLKVGANGEVRIPTREEDMRYVIEIIKHPRYVHLGRLYNDAALLILDRPFPTTGDNRINTLCLPPSDIDLEGAICQVAGWGRKDVNGQSSRDMKKVQVPFVDHDQCQTFFRRTKLGRTFNLHPSFMCAGSEAGEDACMGDGGGPLMCKMPSEEERFFQAGIVSWGIGCGQEDVPGAYTDVEKVSKWIRGQLSQRNLNI